MFLLVGLFSRWWHFPFVLRRTSFSLKTKFSLVISDFYSSFCLLFDWIPVAFLSICCNRLNLINIFHFWDDIFCCQPFWWLVSNFSFWLCEMIHNSCSFWTSWQTVVISVCQKHPFSPLHSWYLCPFFSVDNCARLMLLTKHVIRLNHYHCRNPPVYGNIV